jgi:DNA polymerase-3 subunit gamma/tau
MRDSQSLLEQLLAAGHRQISAEDVNQLLGIAPAERLSGLIRHLVARDAASALAELDATIQGGVEVGLLLDQLVGYFRDVMAAAVGCPAEQMLYALPSQADEVAAVAKQLGLSTILAIGQVLDHTAARMRVSTHGRTLVEMAMVRICQLDELDDLASMIAELRGTTGDLAGVDRQRATGAAAAKGLGPIPPLPPTAKKNDEPGAATLAREAAPVERRNDPSHGKKRDANELQSESQGLTRRDNVTGSLAEETPARDTMPESISRQSDESPVATDSVLAQFQRAMAGGGAQRPAAPPRPSRREETAQIAEQPFVKRAVELFEVSPEKIRYSPPGDEKQ